MIMLLIDVVTSVIWDLLCFIPFVIGLPFRLLMGIIKGGDGG